MATNSDILAWRIPWTEEPGRLQSMGSQESDKTQQLDYHHRKAPLGLANAKLHCLQLLRSWNSWISVSASWEVHVSFVYLSTLQHLRQITEWREEIPFHICLIQKVAFCPFQCTMQPRIVFWGHCFCVPLMGCYSDFQGKLTQSDYTVSQH